jgi:excisionase family DNA binding protein
MPALEQSEHAVLEPLLNLQQASSSLGLGESTCRKLVRLGQLPAIRIGRRLLFEPASLRRFIESHSTVFVA